MGYRWEVSSRSTSAVIIEPECDPSYSVALQLRRPVDCNERVSPTWRIGFLAPWTDLWRSASLVALKGAGHCYFTDRPDEANSAVLNFLGQLDRDESIAHREHQFTNERTAIEHRD
jgi:hypothetical protein